MIKVADYVIAFLAHQGVDTVFTLPGGMCMHLVDSLVRQDRVKPICMLHEQQAAIAADGYAQATGRLGVILVTLGPGATNALTGVAGSWTDSTPVLVLSGQGKRADLMAGRGVRQMAPQEVDIIRMVKPITKFAATVLEPTDIRSTLEQAVHQATTGRRGPVWVELPLDVQGATVEETALRPFAAPPRSAPPATLADQVRQVISLFNGSQRPAILVGNGARLGGAFPALRQLTERLGVPVLTTWMAADFIGDDHPLAFGRPGSIASRWANFVQQNADFLLCIGARLDLVQVGFNYPNFAPRAAKVVVDVDPAELGKLDLPVAVPICADAGEFTAALLAAEPHIRPRDRRHWLARCRAWREQYPVVTTEFRQPSPWVNTYGFVDALSDLLTPQDVIVPGSSGSCAEITFLALRVKLGQRVINSAGLGAMGFGLPSAIGACLGSGSKRTTTIIGDGGLQHNLQALQTVSQLKLPLKIFILNNHGYASIRDSHAKHFGGRRICCDPESGLTFPPLEKIAHAYGLAFTRLDGASDLRAELQRVLDAPGPAFVELLVDPALPTVPKLSSRVLPDGRIVSAALEDLSPFLEREELRRQMVGSDPAGTPPL